MQVPLFSAPASSRQPAPPLLRPCLPPQNVQYSQHRQQQTGRVPNPSIPESSHEREPVVSGAYGRVDRGRSQATSVELSQVSDMSQSFPSALSLLSHQAFHSLNSRCQIFGHAAAGSEAQMEWEHNLQQHSDRALQMRPEAVAQRGIPPPTHEDEHHVRDNGSRAQYGYPHRHKSLQPPLDIMSLARIGLEALVQRGFRGLESSSRVLERSRSRSPRQNRRRSRSRSPRSIHRRSRSRSRERLCLW